MGYFPNTNTPATLNEATSFKTQQGTRGPVVPAGADIKVRYDEHNGCFNASTVIDGKPVYRKDIAPRLFTWK